MWFAELPNYFVNCIYWELNKKKARIVQWRIYNNIVNILHLIAFSPNWTVHFRTCDGSIPSFSLDGGNWIFLHTCVNNYYYNYHNFNYEWVEYIFSSNKSHFKTGAVKVGNLFYDRPCRHGSVICWVINSV